MCQRDNQVVRYYSSIRRKPALRHPALRNPTPTRRTFAEWEASMGQEPPSASKLPRIQASPAFADDLAIMKQTDPWPAGYFENPRPAPVPPPRRELAMQSSEATRAIRYLFAHAGPRIEKRATKSDTVTQVDKPLPLLPDQKPPLTLSPAHKHPDVLTHVSQDPSKRPLQAHSGGKQRHVERQNEVEDAAAAEEEEEEEVGCSGMHRSFTRARRASEVARKFAWPRRRRTVSEC